MNSRAVFLVIGLIIGIPLLILVGQWSATDPFYAAAAALAILGIVTVGVLGRHLWLLILLCAPFTGAINVLPGHFAPRDLIVGAVAPLLLGHWVMRRFRLNFRITAVEIVLFLNLVWLAQAFFRNPTGLAVLGSAKVGGRPYFEIAVSAVGFLILSIQCVDLKRIRQGAMMLFGGGMASTILETAMGLIPAVAFKVLPFYQSAMVDFSLSISDQGTNRKIYLSGFAKWMTPLFLGLKRPLALINPLSPYLYGVLFFTACALLSGFRSVLGYMVLMFIAAMWCRRRMFEGFIFAAIGVPALSLLLLLQGNVLDLPLPAQRALSFLPGDWDNRAVDEAKGSVDWRVEMWEIALTSDRYIQNKFLGDGFGFSYDELAYQQRLEEDGLRADNLMEYYLVTGGYHSGPVESIKRVGYLGLAILVIGMLVLAREGVRLTRRSIGTPYEMPAFFFALPLVILPFMFVFIFGSYATAIGQMCLLGGMIRMTNTSIDLHRESQADEAQPRAAAPAQDQRARRAQMALARR